MLREVRLPIPNARLFLTSMPGRWEPIAEFVARAGGCAPGPGADGARPLVACLTPDDETRRKSPDYWTWLEAGQFPFARVCHPLPDYGVPEDAAAFAGFIEGLAGAVVAGTPVVLHCAGGHGRTGMAAICLLKSLGFPHEEAVRRVREAGSHPDTSVQLGFAEAFACATAGKPLAIAECGIHTRVTRSLDSYAPSPCLSPQAGRGNKCGRRAPCYPLAP